MDEHAIRVEALVEQVLMTIDEPYESLRMTIEKHPYERMGDPSKVGSGAWHLMHVCEVFRIHARAFMGEDEIASWPSMPDGLAEQVEMLKEDAGRFADWCRSDPDRVGDVHHGEDLSFEFMMGVMHRHIVWHAAAVHYWCVWKGQAGVE
tara:strand:- start:56956 stop:57402 length:447 start_codon:yes stop_codon:yes gene_type:complete